MVAEEMLRRPVRSFRQDIVSLTKAQDLYDVHIASKTVVFGVGVAGTGKTWLACQRAAQALESGEIKKIVVTRPAVNADEDLGFLPGELEEKYEPYFRPVREAFEDYFGRGYTELLIKNLVIEARPLGLLRGSTIKDAWLIADEMQNSSGAQMKMLMSRVGENSKFLINGDPTQCDLKDLSKSGLEEGVKRFGKFDWCGVSMFAVDDIVRSGVCRDVVLAYSNIAAMERYSSICEPGEEREGLERFVGQ